MPGLLASVTGLAAAICVRPAGVHRGRRHEAAPPRAAAGVIANYRLLPEPLVPAVATTAALRGAGRSGLPCCWGRGASRRRWRWRYWRPSPSPRRVNIGRRTQPYRFGLRAILALRQPLSRTLVARNLILIGALVLQPAASPRPTWPGLLIAAGGGHGAVPRLSPLQPGDRARRAAAVPSIQPGSWPC